MSHFILWILGFGTFYIGLRFDDEVLLITAALVGTALIIGGLIAAPVGLQITVEVVSIIALFFVCMKCIERGNR